MVTGTDIDDCYIEPVHRKKDVLERSVARKPSSVPYFVGTTTTQYYMPYLDFGLT